MNKIIIWSLILMSTSAHAVLQVRAGANITPTCASSMNAVIQMNLSVAELNFNRTAAEDISILQDQVIRAMTSLAAGPGPHASVQSEFVEFSENIQSDMQQLQTERAELVDKRRAGRLTRTESNRLDLVNARIAGLQRANRGAERAGALLQEQSETLQRIYSEELEHYIPYQVQILDYLERVTSQIAELTPSHRAAVEKFESDCAGYIQGLD